VTHYIIAIQFMDDKIKTYNVISTASKWFVLQSTLAHVSEFKSYLIKSYQL